MKIIQAVLQKTMITMVAAVMTITAIAANFQTAEMFQVVMELIPVLFLTKIRKPTIFLIPQMKTMMQVLILPTAQMKQMKIMMPVRKLPIIQMTTIL